MTTTPAGAGIFAGIRVVEFGQYVAAPYAAEQFAHGGAEVVCVEPLRGTPTRHVGPRRGTDGTQFVVKARGKRSVALALGTEEGREAARRLCLDADVVISNLRPGAAERMGLDHETLRAEKPSLIYGEVDGFGEGAWSDRACVDLVAQAHGGLIASTASTPSLEFDRQQLFCDYTAGTLLAFGVAAALFHRERTGEGQRVATSLVAAALVLQHRTASVMLDHDQAKLDLVDARRAGLGFDEAFERRRRDAGVMPSTYGTFRTRDGWVAIGAIPSHFARFCDVVGVEGDGPDGRPAPDAVASAIAERSSGELVEALVDAGIPVAPVRFLEEVLLDPDSEAAGLVQRHEHPRLGTVVMPAPPVRFGAEAAFVAAEHTPLIGQHTADELRRLDYDDETIDRLVADGIVVASSGEPG